VKGELEYLGGSLVIFWFQTHHGFQAQLRVAYTKFGHSMEALQSMEGKTDGQTLFLCNLTPSDSEILVPVTSALYVPGFLAAVTRKFRRIQFSLEWQCSH
jgi:hypothetical protein